MPGESVPFPEIKYESPDWDAIYKRLDSIKAPEYREEAFNPQMVMANMLMNADLVNMDFSRAGQVMQDAFTRRAKIMLMSGTQGNPIGLRMKSGRLQRYCFAGDESC